MGQTHSGFQKGPSQDLPTLIIYLKNIIALKGQDGIYGLGISVLRCWKESQRFYGSVGFFLKKVFKTDNLSKKKKKEKGNLVPNPNR